MLRISFYNWYNLHNIIRKHINLIDFVRYKNLTSSNTSNIYKNLDTQMKSSHQWNKKGMQY